MFVFGPRDVGDVFGALVGLTIVLAIISVIAQYWWIVVLGLALLGLIFFLVIRRARLKEQARFQKVADYVRQRYDYPDGVEVSPRTVKLQEEINSGDGYPRLLETSVRMDKRHPEYEKELLKYRMPDEL